MVTAKNTAKTAAPINAKKLALRRSRRDPTNSQAIQIPNMTTKPTVAVAEVEMRRQKSTVPPRTKRLKPTANMANMARKYMDIMLGSWKVADIRRLTPNNRGNP